MDFINLPSPSHSQNTHLATLLPSHPPLVPLSPRPLPPEMERYAREDTHYLLYIYDRMRNELLRRSTSNGNLLRATLNWSTEVCLKTYNKPVFDEEGYLKLYYKHHRNFNPQQVWFACKYRQV